MEIEEESHGVKRKRTSGKKGSVKKSPKKRTKLINLNSEEPVLAVEPKKKRKQGKRKLGLKGKLRLELKIKIKEHIRKVREVSKELTQLRRDYKSLSCRRKPKV